MTTWYAYIIETPLNEFYISASRNPDARLVEHQQGNVKETASMPGIEYATIIQRWKCDNYMIASKVKRFLRKRQPLELRYYVKNPKVINKAWLNIAMKTTSYEYKMTDI